MTRLARNSLSLALTLSLALVISVIGPTAPQAYAVDYPSWSDVVKARGKVTAVQKITTQLRSAIAQLESEVAAAEQKSEKAGQAWGDAQADYALATYQAEELQKQADAAEAVADESSNQAAELAAQLSRNGSGDLTLDLLFSNEDADDLLYRLGVMDHLGQQSTTVYKQATADRNEAQSLQDQAAVAQGERAELEQKAADTFELAQAAAIELQEKTDEQAANLQRMQYQLAQLKKNKAATEADYKKGVAAAIKAQAQLDADRISSQGWGMPILGAWITSGYGGRINPVLGYWLFHNGVDMAQGFNTPIYSAAAGTVVYAGWSGAYGNLVVVDHGGGVRTNYAHIINGGITVKIGQQVGVGQQIAKVGSTGRSTGPHVHFEVSVNGAFQNPETFMSARGIRLRG